MLLIFTFLNKIGILLVIGGYALQNEATTKFNKVVAVISIYFGMVLFLIPEQVVILTIPFSGNIL